MNTGIDTAVIVRSKTRYEQLVARFNTKSQAAFYVTQNQMQFKAKMGKKSDIQMTPSQAASGSAAAAPMHAVGPVTPKMRANKELSEFSAYEEEHEKITRAIGDVQDAVSKLLKVKLLDRDYLSSYIFSKNDVVIVIGQDGLVANTAKYLEDNPLIGINPLPDGYDGILLPFQVATASAAVERVLAGEAKITSVTMAEALLNDNQRLLAFNDLFVGIRDHSSARYQITVQGITENHSSSGIIVSTGAGSTGWLSSLYNMANGISRFVKGTDLCEAVPLPWDTSQLVYVVREPFKSKRSQTGLAAGMIGQGEEIVIESLMPTNGVIFSDGVQQDFLEFNSGAIARIRIAETRARLVSG
ncbi:MAG: NAD(+)/NADH kinase [Spirochaetales bacterium]|nr:NAD(+)/NADH kinase [Spirochaetales bacterium]